MSSPSNPFADGSRFGKLTIIQHKSTQKAGAWHAKVHCDCGHEFEASIYCLRNGSLLQCIRCTDIRQPPIIGSTQAQLTVIGYRIGRTGTVAEVALRCTCGKEFKRLGKSFFQLPSQSCKSCSSRRNALNRVARIGYASIIPDRAVRLSWLQRHSAMVSRCHNPSSNNYNNYGRRGIRVHPDWHDKKTFLHFVKTLPNWDRPAGYDLDRIDNNGNYEPDNVRLVTRKVNNENRRTARQLQREIDALRVRLAALDHD